MYTKIMVPVDLTHIERLKKALTTATDLAKHYGIPILFVGVTAEPPTELGHTPEEYAERLEEWSARQAEQHGLTIENAAYSSHDPTIDLNDTLIAAAAENGADLIVMASHIPGLPEHFFASHAGAAASHAKISVFVVR